MHAQILAAELRAKSIHAELTHLERLRTMGQMASGLAHELDQPIGAILNYGVTLRSATSEGGTLTTLADIRPALTEIVTQAGRAAEIVRRARAFVKKQEPIMQSRDINELIRETIAFLSFDLRRAGVRPELTLDDKLPHAMVDAIQIQQVLVNLVRNAVDAMAEVTHTDCRLLVTTAIDVTSAIRVTVTDKGCGVSPEMAHRIFESFFTTKANGLGLGLSLCRSMIEEHGGHLTAEANPEGGMTFSFTVPAAANHLSTVRQAEVSHTLCATSH